MSDSPHRLSDHPLVNPGHRPSNMPVPGAAASDLPSGDDGSSSSSTHHGQPPLAGRVSPDELLAGAGPGEKAVSVAELEAMLPTLGGCAATESVPETVLGPSDDRAWLNDPFVLPFSAICRIQAYFSSAGKIRYGSGWLARSQVIVTAGHNLVRKGQYADRVELWFGQSDGQHVEYVPPFSVDSRTIRLAPGYKIEYPPTDYAFLKLPSAPVHAKPLPHTAPTNSHLSSTQAVIVPGYPHYTSGGPTGYQRRRMYVHSGRLSDFTTKHIVYLVDTSKGQSGSPVIRQFTTRATGQAQWIAIGVHNTGFTGSNQGRRLTDKLLDSLEKFA